MDIFLTHFISNLQNQTCTPFFKLITNLGGTVFIGAASMVMLVWLVWRLKFIEALFFGSGTIISALLVAFLKLLVARPRPYFSRLVIENDFSFPSGHAFMSTIFYSFLLFLILRNAKKPWIKIVFTLLLPLLIVLIGVSRIYLGVHWVTDVLASWLIAGIVFFILIKLIQYAETGE